MPKFRKKPVVVEAIKYLGSGNIEGHASPDWMWKAYSDGTLRSTNGSDPLICKTPSGEVTISPGTWIIQGVQGEIYPCEPDVFEETYDEALKERGVDKLAREAATKVWGKPALDFGIETVTQCIADAIRTALKDRGVIPLDATDSVLLEIMLDASMQLSGEAKQKLQDLYAKQPLAVSANLQRALEEI